ncbi:hypothetical protein BH11ARM1_BH11ARM1_00720 [soil metagenome]
MRLLAGALFALAFANSYGQMTVDHPYNGLDRPLWVNVQAPKSAKDIEIQLLKPVSAQVEMVAPVKAGKQDLGKLFPSLWSPKSVGFHYAQLLVDGKKVGPAVVLQPMLNPTISRLKDDKKTVEFIVDEDGPLFNGYRAYVDQNIVIDTDFGQMEFRTRPDAAPNTTWNIMQLALGELYTNTIFHRVVAKRADGTPFVIQGGDPAGTGSGSAGFAYPLEDSPLEHDFGVLSIARSTDPNTNGCQFFVCLSREGTKHLDHKYASFGQCIRGGDVILKIGAVPVGDQDRPKNPPIIKRVYLVNAKPYGEGPEPLKRPAQ